MALQADLVFAGGPVYTADASGRQMTLAVAADGRPASAVAVSDGRIALLGDTRDRDFRDLIGPRTQVVDLRGRALLPGFQDAHVHPAFAGITMISCNLMGAASLDEALARIAAYAEGNPGREWIAGSGWRMEWFPRGTPEPRDAGSGHRRQRPRTFPTATGTAPGRTPGRWNWRASTGTRRTRWTAGSSGTTTAGRRARCTRARRTWSAAWCRN